MKSVMDKLGELLVHVDIQGGEVGLLPIELIQYFFQTINRPVAVSTNGEFLRRKYHLDAQIRPHIEMIMWHLTDNFNTMIVDYTDSEIMISRGIVHPDVDEIVEFVKRNNHILFDYIEFEFDIAEARKKNVSMYRDLLDKIDGFENVSDNAREILHRRLSEEEEHRDNCSKYNHTVAVDMVNENICLCQRQPQVSIPLSKENLIKRLKTFPKDLWEENSCETCTRLYAGKFYGNVIERALKTRSRI
jgi:hypothetical protein